MLVGFQICPESKMTSSPARHRREWLTADIYREISFSLAIDRELKVMKNAVSTFAGINRIISPLLSAAALKCSTRETLQSSEYTSMTAALE